MLPPAREVKENTSKFSLMASWSITSLSFDTIVGQIGKGIIMLFIFRVKI